MSRKSSGFRTLSRRAKKEKQIQSLFESKEKQTEEARGSRRSLLLLGLMILLIFTVGAVASWRGFSNNFTGTGSSFNPPVLPVPTPPALPANQPSKEFIYAGSALLATTEPFRAAPDDLAVWRTGNGMWYVFTSQQTVYGYQLGVGTDIPAQGDFDGDGKADLCVYRASTGTWYIVNSSSNDPPYGYSFGASADVPAVADYDGDGKDDIAVFRPSDLNWYIVPSSGTTYTTTSFGASGDVPVSADYDGDGKDDIAVWRDSNATFYVLKSTTNQMISYSIGLSGDIPVVGDYDGDGKADFASWRKNGDYNWRIYLSSTNSINTIYWGLSTDIEVQGDYDHDGVTDVAVWRPSNGTWYIRKSSESNPNYQMYARQFGQAGDIPVPAPWRK